MEELLSLKWNNHQSTFLNILSILREKQLYSDATLACDGKFYSVHRLVLSTCSDYFSAMFDRTTMCKNPIIVLKDIGCEELEVLLDYMYLGEVNVRQSNLVSLMKAAECLQVKGLAVPEDEPSLSKHSHSDNSNIRNSTDSHSSLKRKRRKTSESTPSANHSPDRCSTNTDIPPLKSSKGFSSPKSPPTRLSNSSPLPSVNSKKDVEPIHNNNFNDAEAPTETFIKVEKDDDIVIEDENTELSRNDFKDVITENAYIEDIADTSNEFLHKSNNDEDYSQPYPGPSYKDPDLQNWHLNQSVSGSDIPGGSFMGQSQDTQNDVGNQTVLMSLPNNSSFSGAAIQSSNTTIATTSRPRGRVTFSQELHFSHSLDGLVDNSRNSYNFICEVCPKRFPTAWHLRRHVLSHTNTRPYKCPYCTHKSHFKHNLKLHILGVHKGSPFNYILDDDRQPHSQT